MNSARQTGLERMLLMLRLSISFDTRPMPTKTAINSPITEMELRLKLTRMICSIPTEIVPNRIEAPISSSANTMRL